MNTLKPVDHTALVTNQAFILILVLLAFVLNLPIVLAVLALFMLVGTVSGHPGFGWVYRYFLRPSGLLKPDVVRDNPEPHRFAQVFGGLVVVAGYLFLFLASP